MGFEKESAEKLVIIILEADMSVREGGSDKNGSMVSVREGEVQKGQSCPKLIRNWPLNASF